MDSLSSRSVQGWGRWRGEGFIFWSLDSLVPQRLYSFASAARLGRFLVMAMVVVVVVVVMVVVVTMVVRSPIFSGI